MSEFTIKRIFIDNLGDGRPTMAQSKILNYDGTYVTYYYKRHEDGKRIEVTIHVYEFIKLLIKHILDKHFKVFRYHDLYAKEHKHSKKIINILLEDKENEFKKIWHTS